MVEVLSNLSLPVLQFEPVVRHVMQVQANHFGSEFLDRRTQTLQLLRCLVVFVCNGIRLLLFQPSIQYMDFLESALIGTSRKGRRKNL